MNPAAAALIKEEPEFIIIAANKDRPLDKIDLRARDFHAFNFNEFILVYGLYRFVHPSPPFV